jgi:hypothetical protein
MKRITIFFTVLLLSFSSTNAQEHRSETAFLIDTCITIMQANAVTVGEINWAVMREQALKKASEIKDPYQLGSTIRYLFQSIGDYHGRFFYNDSVYQWTKHETQFPDSVLSEWKKGVKVTTKMLTKTIGYLRMPSMPYPAPPGADKAAQEVNDSLCSLFAKDAKAVILDLRLDGGGNFAPMILGTKQLFGSGKIGSFIDARNNQTTWEIEGNRFLVDTTLMASISPRLNLDASDIPVVALIGPGTGSSGEFFAIALKGRKHTTFIGTSTAGYVTSIKGIAINKEAFINLSTGYGLDKSGKIYKTAIEPDIRVDETDHFNDLINDPKILEALRILSDQQ